MSADRQRKEHVSSFQRAILSCAQRWLGTVAVLGCWVYPVNARGAISAGLPYLESSPWMFRASLRHQVGLVPAFRAGERDRSEADLKVARFVADDVRLDAAMSFLSERRSSGQSHSGIGDVRLGVWTSVLQLPGVTGGLGWRVKLPNAQDQAELGTDETDVTVLATAATDVGKVRLVATGGVVIMGDPIRFSSQDDAALVEVDASVPLGKFYGRGSVGGTLATTRNPARLEAELGVAYGCRWRVGADGAVGLTSAAPRYGIVGWVGLGPACD